MSDAVEIEKLKAQVKNLTSVKSDLERRNNRLSANYDRKSLECDELKHGSGVGCLKNQLQMAADLFLKPSDDAEKYIGEYRRTGSVNWLWAIQEYTACHLNLPVEMTLPAEAIRVAIANADKGFQDKLTDPRYFHNGFKKDGTRKGRARKSVQDEADDAFLAYAMDVTIAAQDVQQLANPPIDTGAQRRRPPVGDRKSLVELPRQTDSRIHTHLGARDTKLGLLDKIVIGNRELEAIGTILKHLGLKGDEADALRKRLIHTRKNKGKWSPLQKQFYRILKKRESLMLEDGLIRGEKMIETKRIIMENILSRLKVRHGWGNDKGGKCDLLR